MYVPIYTNTVCRLGLREFAGCLVVDCGFVFRGIKILRLPKSGFNYVSNLAIGGKEFARESRPKYLIAHVLETVFSPILSLQQGFEMRAAEL